MVAQADGGSASCSRCVAEWLARMAARRSLSTRSSTTSPTFKLPLVTVPTWAHTAPSFFSVSETATSAPPAEKITPASPDLTARFAVEGRLVDDDHHLIGRCRRSRREHRP
ncbi:hypothetical protein [Azospirillum sp. INR13]|uniref:hypothetical protein n=1 Tax=Azospirillum sp. INR13 TaxID=2596919 RepID=UPI00351C180A